MGPFSVARELPANEGCSGDCLLKSKAKEWSGESWPNSTEVVDCSGDLASCACALIFAFGELSGEMDIGLGLSSLEGEPSASWKGVGVCTTETDSESTSVE